MYLRVVALALGEVIVFELFAQVGSRSYLLEFQ